MLQYLVLRSRPKDPGCSSFIQTKFPGGRKDRVDVYPLATALRELEAETYLRVVNFELIFEVAHIKISRDHYQKFFAVPFEHCSGILRKKTIEETNSILYPPYFVSADKILQRLHGNHYQVGRALMEYLPEMALQHAL